MSSLIEHRGHVPLGVPGAAAIVVLMATRGVDDGDAAPIGQESLYLILYGVSQSLLFRNVDAGFSVHGARPPLVARMVVIHRYRKKMLP